VSAFCKINRELGNLEKFLHVKWAILAANEEMLRDCLRGSLAAVEEATDEV
jgi:hypothetical protein